MSPVAADNTARLDKWLWAVRLFKSRALSADACRAGSVTVAGHPAKASRDLRPGDKVEVRQGLVLRTLLVVAVPRGRVSAKQVSEYATDLTPPEEFEKARVHKVQHLLEREKGSGRPTKRERRLLDAFLDS